MAARRVELTPAARRQLDRLPPRVAVAIAEFVVTVLPVSPERLSKPLTREFAGLRSARRGDYRVLLWIDDGRDAVIVVRIAHRADVYRPRTPAV